MEWWGWVLLVLAVLVFLTAIVWGVQVRRRRGGVVAQRSVGRRLDKGGS